MTGSGAGDARQGAGTLVAYGQFVVPLAIIGLPIGIYIPAFYASTLGLDLAVVGFILMAARLSDVVTDPLIGHLSDKTRSRWGRRRPWILVGAPLMIAASIMLFMPPDDVSNLYLFVAISAIYLAFTLMAIPYVAWGADLSTDYQERSRISGTRELFLQGGLLIAISIPVAYAVITGGGEDVATSRGAMAWLGWSTILLIPLGTIWLLARVKEPNVVPAPHLPFTKGLKIVLANGPFRFLLVASMFGALSMSVGTGVAVLFFQHALQLGEQAPLLIFVLFICAMIGAPVWVHLAGRFSKHKALACAAGINIAAFAMVPPVVLWLKPAMPDAVFPAMLLISAVQGFTSSAGAILGLSILADIGDLDTLKSGRSRSAFLVSFLGMVRKIFEALGIGIALPVLAWGGFEVQAKTQTEQGISMLLVVYCLVPLVLSFCSMVVIWNYPISRERQVRIQAAIQRRSSRRSQAER